LLGLKLIRSTLGDEFLDDVFNLQFPRFGRPPDVEPSFLAFLILIHPRRDARYASKTRAFFGVLSGLVNWWNFFVQFRNWQHDDRAVQLWLMQAQIRGSFSIPTNALSQTLIVTGAIQGRLPCTH
jgi:hypothetical protein